jgi:hypothetical protein
MALPHGFRSRAVQIVCTLLIAGLASPISGFAQNGSPTQAPRRGAGHRHSVDLRWKASISRVDGYNVYRSEMAAGPFMKLNAVLLRATRYSDASVQAGHTYFYKVTAVDKKGQESLFSNQIKAVVPSP